jgi:hypothetical protein
MASKITWQRAVAATALGAVVLGTCAGRIVHPTAVGVHARSPRLACLVFWSSTVT